jgi:hypothetical protein
VSNPIPILAAGLIQSGLALVIMPTPAGGFAVVLTQADRLDHDELGEWGALATSEHPIRDTPIDELAYRLGSAADGLADFLVQELGGEEWEHVEPIGISTQETGDND